MKSPIPYAGGKTRLADWIISFFPEHKTYIEVFGGSGAVLFAKPRSHKEVYNDLNGDATNFFVCLRDNPNRLAELVSTIPYSRELHEKWVNEWDSDWDKKLMKTRDDFYERAARWFFIINTSFSAKWKGGFIGTGGHNAMTFENAKLNIAETSKRLLGVIIEQLDFEDCIKKYDGEDVVMYLDPPYILGEYYYKGSKTRWGDEEHERLAKCLTKVKSCVIMSYYPDKLLDKFYKGWHRETKEVAVVMNIEKSGKRHKETELLLMNFKPKQRGLV